MNNSVDNKKRNNGIWYMILSLLTLLVAVLGASIAYKIFDGSKDNDVIIEAGTLSIRYIDGRVVNNPALFPRLKPVSIDDITDTYRKEFTVRSTGSLSQILTIYFDVSKNEFSDNNLAYILYEDGILINSGYINGVGKINLASGMYLESSKEKKYTLLVYFLENGDIQDSEKDKNITGGFIIDAMQYINK